MVEASIKFNFGELKGLYEDFQIPEEYKSDFELKRKLSIYEQSIEFTKDSEEGISEELKVVGHHYASKDGFRSLVVTDHHLTYSFLKSYTNFDNLTEEALLMLKSAVKGRNLEYLEGIGVAFSNEFYLPLPLEVADYFKLGVKVPEEWNYERYAVEFFVMLLHDKSTGLRGRIRRELTGVLTGEVMVKFDIFVYEQEDVSLKYDDALMTCLQEIRKFKNRIFFGAFTNKTLNQFK